MSVVTSGEKSRCPHVVFTVGAEHLIASWFLGLFTDFPVLAITQTNMFIVHNMFYEDYWPL